MSAAAADGPRQFDLQALITAHAGEWTALFSRWLAALNARNANLYWWAYTSTAKNLLSSGLGNRLLEVLAVREVVRLYGGMLEVRGATPGQMEALAALLASDDVVFSGAAYQGRAWARWSRRLAGVLRQCRQALRVWLAFARTAGSSWRQLELCLFTYLDTPRRAGADGYFGNLHDRLRELRPALRVGHAVYVYTPYRRRIRELRQVDADRSFPLFGLLRAGDVAASWWRAIRALFPPARLGGDTTLERSLWPLLQEALVEDVSFRGYLHNLLVYRAVRRFAAESAVRTFIYPYENKSLEKALLLGLRHGKPGLRVIGYQHTSITPRHVTLRFEPGEAEITPLPERIVTVGDVTRSYLERQGHYPEGIFVTGCALRQAWDPLLPRERRPGKPLRVLVPLSSSGTELVETVAFMRAAQQIRPIEVAVRTHPNFPISLLPADLRAWVAEKASDLSGTRLSENLEWCDVVAYVSSTVALEALMRGRPVANLRLSDAIDPDPLLEPLPLAWKVDSPLTLCDALRDLERLGEPEFVARRDQSIARMKAYFRPVSNEALMAFLPA